MWYTRWTCGGISIAFLFRPNGNFFFVDASSRFVVVSFKLRDRRADLAVDFLFDAALFFFFPSIGNDAVNAGVTTLDEEALCRGGVRGVLRLGALVVVAAAFDGDERRLLGVDDAAAALLPRLRADVVDMVWLLWLI